MPSLVDRYERELAGTGFATKPPAGWDFKSFFGQVDEDGDRQYHRCLSHRTAQYWFALDENLAVFVLDGVWIQLFDSVFELVRLEKLWARHLPSRKPRILPLGHHPSIQAFESSCAALLRERAYSKVTDGNLNAVYYTQGDVIRVGRFYDSSVFSLSAIRYC